MGPSDLQDQDQAQFMDRGELKIVKNSNQIFAVQPDCYTDEDLNKVEMHL